MRHRRRIEEHLMVRLFGGDREKGASLLDWNPLGAKRAGNVKMKNILGLVLFAAVSATTLGACSYAGVAVSGDKAVVARNDGFLFGILRKVFVCKVTDGGVSNCQSNDSP
jgi:hypothetical protein